MQTEALRSVNAARLLALYIDEILGNSTLLAGENQADVSQDDHPYLTAYTRSSVRKYVVDQSTLGVFEEHSTGSRSGVEKKFTAHFVVPPWKKL